MTPVSGRFLVPLLALLLAASIPLIIHYGFRSQVEDCADPMALTRLEFDGVRVENEDTDEYTDAIIQYTNATFAGGAEFRWVRTLIPRHVYAQRPSWVPGPRIFRTPVVRRIDVDGVELPIWFWEMDWFGQTRSAAYLLIYQGQPMERVVGASLAVSLRQLVEGPRPVNFVGVHGLGPNPQFVRNALTEQLKSAWRYYQRVCGT